MSTEQHASRAPGAPRPEPWHDVAAASSGSVPERAGEPVGAGLRGPGRLVEVRVHGRGGQGVVTAAVAASKNTVFEEKLQPAQEQILEGAGLAEPIAQTELFPRAAVQMMRVGEATGTLDQQLENAADYYSTELDYKLKRLTTLFEPIVIVVMGLVVGFVAIALVQAMYGIYNQPAINNL